MWTVVRADVRGFLLHFVWQHVWGDRRVRADVQRPVRADVQRPVWADVALVSLYSRGRVAGW
jgi:hypothetical protein